MAHGALGDTAKQQASLKRGLAISQTSYGPDHPYTLKFREKLSSLLPAAAAKATSTR